MKWVIGIDEVGRGPLAGPIAVGALAVPEELNLWEEWEGLKDSKKLTEKKREEWFLRIEADKRISWQVTSNGAGVIDVLGIVGAANDAAARAIERLALIPEDTRVLLDYGLSVPELWQQEQHVRGDETIPVIALASIMAKVTRDRFMIQMSEKYSEYGFEKHKGYGTKQHQDAILSHGPIVGVHRKLFLRNLLKQRSQVS